MVWGAGESMQSSKFTDQLVNYQLITENPNPLCEMSCCITQIVHCDLDFLRNATVNS